MAQIKTITKDGVAVYPTTKTRAVTNNEGALLDDILNQKSDKSITLSGYGITDAYTKTEIDNKISAVFRYKGSVSTLADLIDLTGMIIGDVYNVTETGDNYVLKKKFQKK